MTGVCFHFDAEEAVPIDLDAWRAVVPLAGDVDTVAVIGCGAKVTFSPEDAMGLCLYANMNQFLDDHRAGSMVYVRGSEKVESAAVPLWGFDHDIDWYLFGSDGELDPMVDTVVAIPLPSDAGLPMVQLASTVLLHRHWMKACDGCC